MQLTVANDPQIRLSEQTVTSSSGSLQQATGAYDWSLLLTPSFTYANTGLLPAVRRNENDRRLKLQTVATAFGIVNRFLLDSINGLEPRPPRCPIEFPSVAQILNLNADPLAISFPAIPGFENVRFSLQGGIRDSLLQFKTSGVCGPPGDGGNSGQFVRLLDSTFRRLTGSGLEEATVTLQQTPHEILGVTQQISEAVASKSTLALNRLGVVPVDEVVTTSKLDVGMSRFFRSGLTGGFTVHFQSDADNFKDKSLDPNFGGLGKPIFFRFSSFGTLNIPLARGRGQAAVAPERAAQLTLNAQGDQWRHTVSEEAFRTVLAYLSLVGAQETVRSLEESAQRQTQIAQLTQLQVNSGDIAAVENVRAQARAASVATSLSQARGGVIDARVSLAEAMGVDVETIANAPLAADAFAMTLGQIPDVAAMTAAAMTSRMDARAIASLRNAARILEDGAFANARPRLDLFLKGGMGTFYDDLTFYYLPDEQNPAFTLLDQLTPPALGFAQNGRTFQQQENAVRFGSLTGFYRAAFQRRWQPLWAATFVLDVPFHNNALRGRAAQAEAARQRAEVQERDLFRSIRDNIVGQVGSLRRQAEAIERAQAAVALSQQTVDSVILRFQMGDQTLIDTILAEEGLTQDRLTVVRLWQEYLSALARLRFETGTLVSFTGNALTPDQVRFDPTTFVRR